MSVFLPILCSLCMCACCVCFSFLLWLPASLPSHIVSSFFVKGQSGEYMPYPSRLLTNTHSFVFTSGLCACDKVRQVRREEGRGHWKMCVHTRNCGLVCVWSPVIRSLWRRKAPFNVLVSAASHRSDKHTSSPAAVPVISHQSSSPACPCSALPGNALYVS